MRVAGLMWTLLAFGATGTQAAPPLEPVTARVIAVDVAGREIVADGITWALESTVSIRMPGKKSASLRDLKPGMNVRLALVAPNGAEPVVRTVTVIPD